MTVFDVVINNDVKNFVVCHRVKYKLWGDPDIKSIDIATNFDYPLNDVLENTPNEVISNAIDYIRIMNEEYIKTKIPITEKDFELLSFTIITSTGEEVI
jgi:hypothetical protein